MTTSSTHYSRFLKHRSRMERAAGQYIVQIIETGHLSRLLPDARDGSPGALVYSSGAFKGCDRDVRTLIQVSGVAHARKLAATKAWREFNDAPSPNPGPRR